MDKVKTVFHAIVVGVICGAPLGAAAQASKPVPVDICTYLQTIPGNSSRGSDVMELPICWDPPSEGDNIVGFTFYYGLSSCGNDTPGSCDLRSPEADKAYPYRSHIAIPETDGKPPVTTHEIISLTGEGAKKGRGTLKNNQVIYSRLTSLQRVVNTDGSVTIQESVSYDQSCMPTTPQNLTVKALSATQAELHWEASTDPVGIWKYIVLKDGKKAGETAGTSYRDEGLTPNMSYVYQIKAVDNKMGVDPRDGLMKHYASNSPPSLPVEIVTPHAAPGLAAMATVASAKRGPPDRDSREKKPRVDETIASEDVEVSRPFIGFGPPAVRNPRSDDDIAGELHASSQRAEGVMRSLWPGSAKDAQPVFASHKTFQAVVPNQGPAQSAPRSHSSIRSSPSGALETMPQAPEVRSHMRHLSRLSEAPSQPTADVVAASGRDIFNALLGMRSRALGPLRARLSQTAPGDFGGLESAVTSGRARSFVEATPRTSMTSMGVSGSETDARPSVSASAAALTPGAEPARHAHSETPVEGVARAAEAQASVEAFGRADGGARVQSSTLRLSGAFAPTNVGTLALVSRVVAAQEGGAGLLAKSAVGVLSLAGGLLLVAWQGRGLKTSSSFKAVDMSAAGPRPPGLGARSKWGRTMTRLAGGLIYVAAEKDGERKKASAVAQDDVRSQAKNAERPERTASPT